MFGRIGLFIGILVLLFPTALAQEGRLEPGDPQLDSGEYFDIHFYDGLAGTTLSIRLSSEEFDPYLIVLGPDDAEILQVDDSPGYGLNVNVDLPLTATGSYTVAVTSAMPGETGSYVLELSSLTDPAPAPAPAPTAPVDLEPRVGARPGFVTGTVFDTQGQPLPGAGVRIAGTTYTQGQRTSFETVTGPDGTYAVRVPDGRYSARAWVDTTYEGVHFSRILHPLSGNPNTEVDSVDGGTLDFQWRLTGLHSPPGDDPSDYYGASIDFAYCGLPADAYCSTGYDAFPTRPIAPGGSNVVVALTPLAPLIDGTPGQPLTFEFEVQEQDADYPHGTAPNTLPGYENGGGGRTVLGADWEYRSTYFHDIPIGVYELTATAYLPDGRTLPLMLGLDPEDVEHTSVRVSFSPWEGFSGRSYSSGGLDELDVYVRD